MAPGAAHRGLQSLPKELLTRILRMVHEEDVSHHQELDTGLRGLAVFHPCMLLPLRTVSPAWRGAVDDAMRYFTYNFAPSSLSPSEVVQQSLWWGFVLNSLLPRWQNLATVKLVFDWKASYLRFVLHALRQGCPALETLFLQGEPKEKENLKGFHSSANDPRICTLAPLSNLSSLTLLNFKGFYFKWTLGLSSLTSLKDLRIENGGFENLVAPEGLTQLHVEHNGKSELLVLGMVSATGLLDLTLSNMMVHHLNLGSALLTLQLRNCDVCMITVAAQPALTSILVEDSEFESLSWLSKCSKVADIKLQALEGDAAVDSLPDLSHMTQLTKLDLRGLVDIHRLPPLHCLPSLTLLKVAKCALPSLPQLPPPLRTLRLLHWPQLSSMQELLSAPSLTNLSVRDCPELSILPQLSPLEHLRRVSVSTVGLSSLQALGMLGNTLRTLFMDHLPKLSTLDALSRLHRLSKLRIRRCQQLEQVGPLPLPELASLALEKCAKVREVSSSGFPKIEMICVLSCGATALKGLQELPKLKALTMSGCSNLATLAIGPGLSRLQSLNLVDCAAFKSLVGLCYVPKSAQVSTVIKGQAIQICLGEEAVTAVHRDESGGMWGDASDEEDNWE